LVNFTIKGLWFKIFTLKFRVRVFVSRFQLKV
jgi:hypothetical protein